MKILSSHSRSKFPTNTIFLKQSWTLTAITTFRRTLTQDNIHELLEIFLDAINEPEVGQELAKVFVEELYKILTLFQHQTTFHFYGSSLLFVYDAETAKNFREQNCDSLRDSVSLKMIDFAHVWRAEELPDTNYIWGVTNLIKLFEKFSSWNMLPSQ